MSKDVSPSNRTLTKPQCGKLYDVVADRIGKGGFPLEPGQYVIEHEGAAIADVVAAEFGRRVEARIRAIEPHVLERGPFNPESFLGKGWKVDEQIGTRVGGNLDAGKIVRKDYLHDGEFSVTGEERLKRIKKAIGDVQFDAQDFLALYEEPGQVTLRWLYDTKGITFLSFWATVLRDPDGYRYVLYLCRQDDGSWRWSYRWLARDWSAVRPAAVLDK